MTRELKGINCFSAIMKALSVPLICFQEYNINAQTIKRFPREGWRIASKNECGRCRQATLLKSGRIPRLRQLYCISDHVTRISMRQYYGNTSTGTI